MGYEIVGNCQLRQITLLVGIYQRSSISVNEKLARVCRRCCSNSIDIFDPLCSRAMAHSGGARLGSKETAE